MPENAFMGELDTIAGTDLDGPVSSCRIPCCDLYRSALAQTAKEFEEVGDIAKASLFRFVQDLTSMHPRFDSQAQDLEPFGPMWQGDGERSIIPSDLTQHDLQAVALLTGCTGDAALLARFNDLLWIRSKDHVAAKRAVASYLESAENLLKTEWWTVGVRQYRRGLYLAAKFGRTKPLFLDAAARLVESAKLFKDGEPDYAFCQLLEVLVDCGIEENLEEFKGNVEAVAHAARAKGEFRKSHIYWELLARLLKVLRGHHDPKAARIEAAETLVMEAEQKVASPDPSYMVGVHFLSQGIEALRNAGAAKERISELRGTLGEWQKQIESEMRHFEGGVDISDLIAKSREAVRDEKFEVALLKLAFGQPLVEPNQLKQEAERKSEAYPASSLFGSQILDQKGRVLAFQPPLIGTTGAARDSALLWRAFSDAAKFHWPLRVAGFIEPARKKIWNEHHPSIRDLEFVVADNPFVPVGHEALFLQGLLAGFQGDFVVSSHLLIPQLENSIRHFLELAGKDTTNLLADGTQPAKVLGPLFSMHELTEIFGEPLCFELRGCLIEKSGYDFRNRVAHGFVSTDECFSNAAVTLWWLTLRMCLMAHHNSRLNNSLRGRANGTAPTPPVEEPSSPGQRASD
jgi:hypothetical protein